jgi:hypothetical protein
MQLLISLDAHSAYLCMAVLLWALATSLAPSAHASRFGAVVGCDGRSLVAGSVRVQRDPSDLALPQETNVAGGADEDGGSWQWILPDLQQEDLAVQGDAERTCMNCAATRVVQGVSAARLQGQWVAFFCKHCAPHLSVRNHAQVPVVWTGPAANMTGELTMLPLYKRCRRCRRWATFGVKGASGERRGVKLHCRAHAPPSQVPVHRRVCAAANCTKRPSFAAVGDSLPLRCKTHKLLTDMDVTHSRCRHSEIQEGVRVRCWRMPTYGYKQGAKAERGTKKASQEEEDGKREEEEERKPATAAASQSPSPGGERSDGGGGARARGGRSRGRTGSMREERRVCKVGPVMCWEHRSVDMVQVFFGKCRHGGCTAAPLFARPTERKLSYCQQHRRRERARARARA